MVDSFCCRKHGLLQPGAPSRTLGMAQALRKCPKEIMFKLLESRTTFYFQSASRRGLKSCIVAEELIAPPPK